MPLHFEEAANLLRTMTAKGLAIRTPTDSVQVILCVAATVAGHRASHLTHAVAAGRLLAAMEADAIVSYPNSRRETLVAMLGSFIGNTLALTERQGVLPAARSRMRPDLLGTGVAVGLRKS